ncbi:MAG: aconitate hydratase, partial [Thermoplasmata archaeon]
PKEGGYTRHFPSGESMTIFDAAERYLTTKTPLIVLAGKSYGQGSSRDWAAKGPRLLGVGAIIVESYERTHRANLVCMGVLPLTFRPGEGWTQLGLTGEETFTLRLAPGAELGPGAIVTVSAKSPDGRERSFDTRCELHSAIELEYYRAGGVLPYVMRERFHVG